MNYIGSKSKLIKEIKSRILPTEQFIDIFGGGFNVGVNIDSKKSSIMILMIKL
ncbi:hypothetical protein SUT503_17500 [Streptococcus parasuis]|nr:hypothetical protein SUT503_17500 [Streptococcus parasuis]